MLGYSTRGESVFWMEDEPPRGQYGYRPDEGAWVPLLDGYYLWWKLISGDVDTDGPFDVPPDGIPPVPVLARL